MSITKRPGHKLNFSATVLTLGLKAKIFENLRLLSESFGGNCARAPRLTAVWGYSADIVFHKICCVSVTEYKSTFHFRPQRSLRLITLFA